MRYPQYLEPTARELFSSWQNDLNWIITTERQIVEKNLKTLYEHNDIMETKVKVSPLLYLHKYHIEKTFKHIVFLPKFLATKKLELYWAELNGVDNFLVSLSDYGSTITGKEIFNEILGNTCNHNNELYDRINTVIRKFLSYQYIMSDSQ